MARKLQYSDSLRQFLVCIGILWVILLISLTVTMFEWGSEVKPFSDQELAKVMMELDRLQNQNAKLRRMADELRFAFLL